MPFKNSRKSSGFPRTASNAAAPFFSCSPLPPLTPPPPLCPRAATQQLTTNPNTHTNPAHTLRSKNPIVARSPDLVFIADKNFPRPIRHHPHNNFLAAKHSRPVNPPPHFL